MGFKIDMHVHTIMSGDNDSEPEEMVQMAIERGLDAIVFTEHSSYEASGYAERLSEKYPSILIMRGVEFSASEGHCLVYGANTDPLDLWETTVQDLTDAVLAQGGVVIPSHPFRTGSGIGELALSLKGITALEGANGANIHPMNVHAIKLAKSLSLPSTGGSDAHGPKSVGSCHTEFESIVTKENFIAKLKEGSYRPVDNRKISKMDWLLK